MATLVLLEAKARAGSVEPMKKFLGERLPETRAFDGCRDITACLSSEDGRTFVFVEHWDSSEHYEKYLAWRTETGVLKELESMIEGAPQIRHFEELDV
jgi:quinol monooxygenase YgiN